MNITERTKLRVSGADLRPMATEIVTKEIAKGSNMKVFNILRGAGRKVKVLQDRDAANKQQLRVQIEGVKMKFSSIREKTKWKIGDGRPRNGARIENERFWNLPKASLEYIRKDAHDAMKANPNGKKAGKYADEVNDAATVMAWRKKNGIKESVEEAKTGLPTGQSTVDYENSIQKLMKTLKKDPKNKGKSGNELRKLATLKLTGHKLKEVRKPVSQMTPAEKAADAKKRKEYNAYQKSKRNESVELDEAIDFFKVSKELSDYAKKHGGPDKREFEKAAAYVREIGKNSAVSVQDKAGKGLNMLFKNADTDVRDRMQMILTKGGFKVKGGYVMRESIEEYKKENPMVMNLKGKKVELLKTGSSFKPTFTLTVDGKEKGKFGSEKDAMKHFARMTKESVDEAIGKLGPNASREDKIKHTMKIMKKYPANKGKSEKQLRKGATDYIDQFTNKNKRDDAYIAKMKAKKESVEDVTEAQILTKAARRRKADSKKAAKTYKDIRKGKYPGVKMANEADDDKRDNDPCWDSHKMVGMKKKNGKEVPNCVPK